ncbi:MAG: FAD binding domain-containing protein [Candidatus Methylomirabilales bacterium]
MIPAAFEYHRPRSLQEAVALLAAKGEGAKVLAGGHSLLPLMKFRLARPAALVDLGRIPELATIRETDGAIRIGPMATHASLAASDLLRRRFAALSEAAGLIGDPQVRHRGTLGGSLAHADPAADYPAPVLAFEAEIRAIGPRGERTIHATDFFVDMLTTALRPEELIAEVRLPAPPPGSGSAYAKFPHPASRFAVAGVAAVITLDKGTVQRARIGVTGAAAKPSRATAAEAALTGGPATPERIAAAAAKAADGLECLGDLVASPEYRAHLVCVMARRALEAAVRRASGET